MNIRSLHFTFMFLATTIAHDCKPMETDSEKPENKYEQLAIEIAYISSILAQNKKTFSETDMKLFEQNIDSNKEAIDQLHANGNTDLKKNITNAMTNISWLYAQRFVITGKHVSWRQEQLNELQGTLVNNERLAQLTITLTAKFQS